MEKSSASWFLCFFPFCFDFLLCLWYIWSLLLRFYHVIHVQRYFIQILTFDFFSLFHEIHMNSLHFVTWYDTTNDHKIGIDQCGTEWRLFPLGSCVVVLMTNTHEHLFYQRGQRILSWQRSFWQSEHHFPHVWYMIWTISINGLRIWLQFTDVVPCEVDHFIAPVTFYYIMAL